MTKRKQVNDTTTAFALPSSLMDKITAEAKKDDRTPSYIIRKIVRDHFEGK